MSGPAIELWFSIANAIEDLFSLADAIEDPFSVANAIEDPFSFAYAREYSHAQCLPQVLPDEVGGGEAMRGKEQREKADGRAWMNLQWRPHGLWLFSTALFCLGGPDQGAPRRFPTHPPHTLRPSDQERYWVPPGAPIRFASSLV